MKKWKVITVFDDGKTCLSEFLWETPSDFPPQVVAHLFDHIQVANKEKRRHIDTIIIQPVSP